MNLIRLAESSYKQSVWNGQKEMEMKNLHSQVVHDI